MGHVEENLLRDERVIYKTKLHWAVFIFPTLVGIVGLLALVGGLSAHAPESEHALAPGLGILIIAILLFISPTLSFLTSEFAVTNKRVIIKIGFISRRTLELLLPKVETVSVSQGILGRIFDYGTIVVIGTGGTKEPFPKIAHPLLFEHYVQSAISEYKEVLQPTNPTPN